MNGLHEPGVPLSVLPGPGRLGREAFTLVELMVVMVLIAIMTAMIVPEMKGTFDDALLRSTGRQLVSACNLAYSQAVSGNRLHRLQFDSQSGRYQIERAAAEANQAARFVPLHDVPGAEGQLDKRIKVELRPPEEESPSVEPAAPDAAQEPHGADPADDQSISFFPDGTATQREILLRDREGFRLALRINPTTARVRIIDLGRE